MGKNRGNRLLYLVVLVLGVMFTVSACAYGVMAFRDLRGGAAYRAAETDAGLMRIMRQRGGTILVAEVAALALAAVAAMASDRRAATSDITTDAAAETGNSPDESHAPDHLPPTAT